MKHCLKLSLALAALAIATGCGREARFDLVVYGGTSAGVVAAYTAAQAGLSVAVIEPTGHIGGLTTGGLGYTDIGNKQVVCGVAKQFYRKVGAHYGCLEQWIFEPSVADSIMRAYLRHPRIKLFDNTALLSVARHNNRIARLAVHNGDAASRLCGSYYIDASYEGDLMAAAGISHTIGREPNSRYNETYNGVQLMNGHQFPDGVDPYVIPGDSTSGLLWGIAPNALAGNGTGDTLVQAYNYRICLTTDSANSIAIEEPEDYNAARYELLLRLIEAQSDKQSLNDYFIISAMPNHKTDINNRGGFSTDMIGMNHTWPQATYAQRDSLLQAHTAYTKGLLYFLGHDNRVPQAIRAEMLRYGYPKDEYPHNNHWTPQLYVRESRRMIGEYTATQADCQGKRVAEDGIAMAAYTMDSHNCQRIVIEKDGRRMVKNEGNVEIGGGLPYPIAYRSLTPQRGECANLLVPVCLSASHIAFGSIRMEPVFMVLGQVAALAAAQAIEAGNCDVQHVDSRAINALMAANPYMDNSQPDILVDDASSQVTVSEGWTKVTAPGAFGPTFYELPPAAGTHTATFSATIPTTGTYRLFAYENIGQWLEPDIHINILANDGTHPVHIRRSEIPISGQASSTWVELGTFPLCANQEMKVQYTARDTQHPLRADAILFVKQ